MEPILITPSLTDTLCTRCGLCCDGSLFDDVELAGRAEATKLEMLGLAIDDDDPDGAVLPQRCTALQGTRCGIYQHRPECCRTFECRLLQDARRGAVSVEQAGAHIAEAQERIARAKSLMVQIGQLDEYLPLKERYEEALSGEAGTDPKLSRVHDELETAMSAVQELIASTFLDRGRAPSKSAR